MPKRKPKKKKLKGRERRLDLAPDWVVTHRGKPANVLKRYRKYFEVDWECAIAELKELGVVFDDDYLARLRETISREFQNEKKQIPISRREFDLYRGIEPDSDENFAYIAGYTPAGFPYGTTWEEMEELESGEHDCRGYEGEDTANPHASFPPREVPGT